MASDNTSVTVTTVEGTTKTLVCDDPWLDDGNIVLAVQENCFRVHRTVLGLHSEVFKDMFAVPHPDDVKEDIVDGLGCPVIYLQDNVLDVRMMLRALYDRSFVFFYNIPMPVSVLEAFLKMGKKYAINQLFEEAKRRLKLNSPPLVFASKLTAKAPVTVFTRISGNDPHNFKVMNIANEAGFLSVVALTTFSCCLSCPNTFLADGYEFEGKLVELSASSKRYIILGQYYLAGVERQMIHSLSQVPPNCQGRQQGHGNSCSAGILSLLRSFQEHRSPFSVWIPAWDTGICAHCRAELRRKHEEERTKLWRKFPIALGLSSWEDLDKISEGT